MRTGPCPWPAPGSRAARPAPPPPSPPPAVTLGVASASCPRLHLRQLAERLLHLLPRVLEVLKLAREVCLVGAEVEVAVTGEVEDDRALLPLLLGAERLVDD